MATMEIERANWSARMMLWVGLDGICRVKDGDDEDKEDDEEDKEDDEEDGGYREKVSE